MKQCLEAAKLWRPEFEANIKSLIEDCDCKLAQYPNPHPKVSKTIPKKEKQEVLGIDFFL